MEQTPMYARLNIFNHNKLAMNLEAWEIALLMGNFELYDATDVQLSAEIGKNLL